MMTIKASILISSSYLLASALTFAPAAARADWKGDMHITSPSMGQGPGLDSDGKVFGRKGAIRMDMDGPRGKMSIISDWQARKAWMLMHGMKMAMATNMDRAGVEMPRCDTGSVAGCLEQGGYKKTGSESVNGHPCDVYERDRDTARGKTHVKLWHPTDLDEVPILRSVSVSPPSVQSGKEHKAQVDFTNVALVSSVDSALFSPPSDYRQSSGMSAPGAGGAPAVAIPPNGKMTPDQVQKLREQMMKQYGGGQ